MVTPILPVYQRMPFAISHGKGPYLYAEDGSRVLDFISGVASNSLGHCHPALVKAVRHQAKKLWHVSNLFHIPGMETYASRLTSLTFADTVFFCNSGVEAVECCFKMVRKYHDATGNPDRYRIITFTGAFHGRTLAAIWASKRDSNLQEGFGPPVDGFDLVEFNNIEAVRAAITPETGAILIEPIQGDGGVREAHREFLIQLRKLADEHGLLLCFDEIQTGMGRTGTLFAYGQYGVTPDIMTVAKGIGGGFPMGACLATERAAQGMVLGSHGSTYGGNPMAMAIGQAVLNEVTCPGFLEHVIAMGDLLKKGLLKLQKRYPNHIAEVRGRGLLLGLKIDNAIPCKEVMAQLAETGLMVAPAADNTLRYLPPLIIQKRHVNRALRATRHVFATLKKTGTR